MSVRLSVCPSHTGTESKKNLKNVAKHLQTYKHIYLTCNHGLKAPVELSLQTQRVRPWNKVKKARRQLQMFPAKKIPILTEHCR